MLEQMLHTCNMGFVGPVSFKLNMLVYFSSKSKTACNILSRNGPFGSYTTILNWLNDQGHNAITAPQGDIITFFDNNQVVGKNYKI